MVHLFHLPSLIAATSTRCQTHDHPALSFPNGPIFTEARYADIHVFTLEANSHNPTLWAEINTEKWSLRDAPLRS